MQSKQYKSVDYCLTWLLHAAFHFFSALGMVQNYSPKGSLLFDLQWVGVSVVIEWDGLRCKSRHQNITSSLSPIGSEILSMVEMVGLLIVLAGPSAPAMCPPQISHLQVGPKFWVWQKHQQPWGHPE
ncbi:hypothetical protein BDR04DRAFT_1115834 [Suillus decipiens]|nr:hypothetical protein BDR04DRAFT_1115834 [Suillus decipiens]